jgi:L-lactate dehydrogenase (cytochrome)
MPIISTTEDLRQLARKRVPRMFYDYADSGSWTESTYRRNEADFQSIELRQRVAVDVSARNTKSFMLGQPVSMPVALAPTGLAGMQHADGEILAARAAEQSGVPFILSLASVCSMEDIRAHTSVPFWQQIYIMRDRGFVRSLMERAHAVACPVLVLTVDLPIIGDRHKDARNGLSAPPKMTPRNVINMAMHPRWCMGMLRTKRRSLGNIVGHVDGVGSMETLADWAAKQFDPAFTWKDVEWVRDNWLGHLVIKGILDPDDARIAANLGAQGIVVSNHGGRQLDGATSSVRMLPRIVEAVRGRTEIWLDGGIRSGQDVLKACALGAQGTLIGRPFLYGLGAQGQQGVQRCLDIIQRELQLTMAFTGCNHIDQLGPGVLMP